MAFPIANGVYLLPGWQLKPQSVIERTEMESGPPKQAAVQSRRMKPRDITIQWSQADFDAFETWFEGSECGFGALFFDWTDPRDGNTKQARIVGGDYDASLASAGEGAPVKVVVTMTLEVWGA